MTDIFKMHSANAPLIKLLCCFGFVLGLSSAGQPSHSFSLQPGVHSLLVAG